MQRHADWESCQDALAGRRMFALTTKGSRRHDAPAFEKDDVFVFGPESRGLPEALVARFPPISACACQCCPSGGVSICRMQ